MSAQQLLSRKDCDCILRRYFNSDRYELLDYKLVPLSENVEGFLGEHCVLNVNAKLENRAHSLSFFLKREPHTVGLQMQFCIDIGAYENELFFYETLVSEFKKYCKSFDQFILPKYFCKKDDSLIFENCATSKFVLVDSDDVLDLDHIKVTLKALAKLHAASISLEEHKSELLGKPYRLTDDYEKYLKESFFVRDENHLGYKFHASSLSCIDVLIDLMPDENMPREEYRKHLHRLAEECFEYSQPSKQFRNVCCHADMWRKNILFAYENDVPVKCKLIDFQLIKYSPPAYDILKFLHQVTSAETRQHHLDELLKLYHDSLTHELKLEGIDATKVLPRHEFEASCKYLLPYTKLEGLYYYTIQRTGMEFIKEMVGNNEMFPKLFFKDRSIIGKRFYKEGTYFKQWHDELLFELQDIFLHDGFSRENCHSIMRRKLRTTHYKLVKYDLKSIGGKAGFLGEHKKLEVTVDFENRRQQFNFFAKFLPQSKFLIYAIETGAFNNEIFMYEYIIPKMAKIGYQEICECVPKCYFTSMDNVLVFEDLTEKGYITLNKHKALNFEHVYIIVGAFAKLHAAAFILEEELSDKTGQTFRICDKYVEQIKEVCYVDEENHVGKLAVRAAIKGIWTHIDMFPDPNSTMSDDVFKKKVEQVYGKLMYKFTEPSKQFRNVVCHGDPWANNILVKHKDDKPIKCKLIDFQGIKRCPPAQDLMAFIYLTTSRKFRLNFLSKVLELYYNELTKCLLKHKRNINKILPYKEFLKSCEYYKLFAIAQCVSHFQFIMMPAHAMEKLFADDVLCYETFYVDRSNYIRKMCDENEQYKFMLGECIKDLRLYLENVDIDQF